MKKDIVTTMIITIIIILYYIAYFGLIISFLPGLLKYIFSIIPLIFLFIFIKTSIERIKEIKRGENDDISEY